MLKLKMLMLLIMIGSFFFLFNEQNSAKAVANICLISGDSCRADGICCSRVCCSENDSRSACFAVDPGTCA